MKAWHFLTDEGWVRVEAKDKPKEGRLIHVEKPSCLNWKCGKQLNLR